MSKTAAPLMIYQSEEFHPVKLTEEERTERATQAAELAKRAQESRNREARLKLEAKDAKEDADSATRESERLLGIFRLGVEDRKVECETLLDELTGDLVKYRTDTGEELARRKPDEGDKLKIDAKRQRSFALDLDTARRAKVEQAAASKTHETAKKGSRKGEGVELQVLED